MTPEPGAIQSRRVPHRPWLLHGLAALALLLALNLALFAAGAATRHSNGFVAYHTSARLLAEGLPVQHFYDDGWFAARIAERGPAIYDVFAPNPPTAALLVLPLAGLDQLDARMIWTLLSLAALMGAVALMLRQTRIAGPWALGFTVLVLLFQPVYANLHQGQVYLLLLGSMVAAWHGFRSRRPAVLGIALGLMLALKTAGLFLWLLPLLRRRWSALAWGAGTVLAVVAGTLPWLGHEAWRAYLSLLPSLGDRPSQAVVAYQTLPGLLRHLLTYDARWNPSPLIAAPLPAVAGLTLLCAGAMLGISGLVAWRRRDDDAAFAAFTMATLILSPLSLDYHYPLALLPLCVLWSHLSAAPPHPPGSLVSWRFRNPLGRGSPAATADGADLRSAPTSTILRAFVSFVVKTPVFASPRLRVILLLGLATALLALDLPYLSPGLAGGAWSLLAYPKLYGALILWGLALWVPFREHRFAPASPREQRQREDRPRDPGEQPRRNGPGGAE
jgi:hypothetical protein